MGLYLGDLQIDLLSGSANLNAKEITENGIYKASDDGLDGYNKVTVNVHPEINLQEKTVTPNETEQNIQSDVGYDGLSKVTVEPIPDTYIGTGIIRKGSATYIPTKQQQTIDGNQYLTGEQIISPIPDQYITTDDATATSDIINNGYTAYVNGVKITGTQVIQVYRTGSSQPDDSLGDDGDIYLVL